MADRERMRALARLGGLARGAKLRAARGQVEPYAGSVLNLMDVAGLVGPSWMPWRALLKAAFCLGELRAEELAIYQRHAGGRSLPKTPVRELWAVVGRRGAKTTISALLGAHRAISREWSSVAGRGEKVVIPIVCADRRQARQQINLLRGLFSLDLLKRYTARILKEQIETRTGCLIEVATADHRLASRGFTCPLVIADECAHWRSETSLNPDVEVVRSLRPSMLTVADSVLFGASSPYAARGVLHEMHTRYFGQDDDRVLVINADTRSLHPGVDDAEIERAWADDPLMAGSEYGRDGHVSFRVDIAALFDAASVDACVMAGRHELPAREGIVYVAACDPSSGKADDMTLAIGHREDRRIVLDLLRVVSPAPKFDPVEVLRQFADDLKRYRVGTLRADKYAAGFVEAEVRRLGLTYRASDETTSEAYRTLLAAVNAGQVELLDHRKLRSQLVQLERLARPGGREIVRHPVGGHDDVAACVALLVSTMQRATAQPLVGPISIERRSPWASGDALGWAFGGRRWPG